MSKIKNKWKLFTALAKNFAKCQQAVTAVEFALVIGPVITVMVIFIDIGFWSLANTTLKNNTYYLYDKWVLETDKTRLSAGDIRISLCSDISLLGVTCDNNTMKVNVSGTPAVTQTQKYQFDDSFDILDNSRNVQKVVILRARLQWSDAFPVSGLLMRLQNPGVRNIYASVLLPD